MKQAIVLSLTPIPASDYFPPTSQLNSAQLHFLLIPSDICPVLSKPPLLVPPFSAERLFPLLFFWFLMAFFYHYVLFVILLQAIPLLICCIGRGRKVCMDSIKEIKWKLNAKTWAVVQKPRNIFSKIKFSPSDYMAEEVGCQMTKSNFLGCIIFLK